MEARESKKTNAMPYKRKMHLLVKALDLLINSSGYHSIKTERRREEIKPFDCMAWKQILPTLLTLCQGRASGQWMLFLITRGWFSDEGLPHLTLIF
jgi:hypothetical protein